MAIADASAVNRLSYKIETLQNGQLTEVKQKSQLANPDFRVTTETLPAGPPLSKHASSYQGLKTGDDARYRRYFFELTMPSSRWRRYQGTVDDTKLFGGQQSVIDWKQSGADMARLQGISAWGHRGVGLNLMGRFAASLYLGDCFDSNIAAVIPTRDNDLSALWAFCTSTEFARLIHLIESGVKISNGTVTKVPFDLSQWQTVADELFPDGLPSPYSNDPAEGFFMGNPNGSTEPLQVAVARLLGYCWPEQTDSDGLERFADRTASFPLHLSANERSAADRLRELLAAAWGDEWSPSVEGTIALGRRLREPDARRLADEWLLRAAREAVPESTVHLAHLGRAEGWLLGPGQLPQARRPEPRSLIYSYLGNWISRQRSARDADVPGADVKLAAALELERKLKLIREGEKPYDIYVRWKSLAEQPIGWEPDLNDGVRMNIRPWIEPFAKQSDNPLRSRVNVKWGKDRGKNPDGSERHNDIHLTLAEKRAARRLPRRPEGLVVMSRQIVGGEEPATERVQQPSVLTQQGNPNL